MKIYTKHGDEGDTSLACGQRLPKDDLRITAYGTIDELNSILGIVCVHLESRPTQPDSQVIDHLDWIQHNLFTLSSMLATANLPTGDMPVILKEDIQRLEEHIDGLQQDLPELQNFILPRGDESVSYLHFARTVCRRAERVCLTLHRQEPLSPNILPFLNRLSDDLFVLARWVGYQHNVPEKRWLGRKG